MILSAGMRVTDTINLDRPFRLPVNISYDSAMDLALHSTQLVEAEIVPPGIVVIIIRYHIPKKTPSLWIILCDIPAMAIQEKMHVYDPIFQRRVSIYLDMRQFEKLWFSGPIYHRPGTQIIFINICSGVYRAKQFMI